MGDDFGHGRVVGGRGESERGTLTPAAAGRLMG